METRRQHTGQMLLTPSVTIISACDKSPAAASTDDFPTAAAVVIVFIIVKV